MPKISRTCLVCGTTFVRQVAPSATARGAGVFCSSSCSGKAKPHPTKRINCTCQQCGKPFDRVPALVASGGGKFCSNPCRHVAMRGRPQKHGATWAGGNTPTYRAWRNMKSRCLNKNNIAYHRYGGRGINICERWFTFENFLTDMGERPDGMTLERVDNDGHYEPSNVCWASRHDQYRNRSNNVWVTHNGIKMVARDAAKIVGINFKAFRRRMEKWPERHWFDPPMRGKKVFLVDEV